MLFSHFYDLVSDWISFRLNFTQILLSSTREFGLNLVVFPLKLILSHALFMYFIRFPKMHYLAGAVKKERSLLWDFICPTSKYAPPLINQLVRSICDANAVEPIGNEVNEIEKIMGAHLNAECCTFFPASQLMTKRSVCRKSMSPSNALPSTKNASVMPPLAFFSITIAWSMWLRGAFLFP